MYIYRYFCSVRFECGEHAEQRHLASMKVRAKLFTRFRGVVVVVFIVIVVRSHKPRRYKQTHEPHVEHHDADEQSSRCTRSHKLHREAKILRFFSPANIDCAREKNDENSRIQITPKS